MIPDWLLHSAEFHKLIRIARPLCGPVKFNHGQPYANMGDGVVLQDGVLYGGVGMRILRHVDVDAEQLHRMLQNKQIRLGGEPKEFEESNGQYLVRTQKPKPEYSGVNHSLHMPANSIDDNWVPSRVESLTENTDGTISVEIKPGHIGHQVDLKTWNARLKITCDKLNARKQNPNRKQGESRDRIFADPGPAFKSCRQFAEQNNHLKPGAAK